MSRGFVGQPAHGGAALALSLVALAATSCPTAGQELTGWLTVHTDEAFDHLVDTENLVHEVTADGDLVVRMFVTRMLVRRIEPVRATLLAAARASTPDPDGYSGYAATTRVVEVRCDQGQVRFGETTDFDGEGGVLQRWTPTPDWMRPSEVADADAMEAVLRWACEPDSTPPHGL